MKEKAIKLMKEKAIKLLNAKVEELLKVKDLKCWYVLKNKARELIGTTYAFYQIDLITPKEKEVYAKIGYNLETIGESLGRYNLIDGKLVLIG